MKTMRLVSLVCVLALCMALFSGCNMVQEVTINSDGSGNLVIRAGVPEEDLEQLIELGVFPEEMTTEMVSYTYHGEKYKGFLEEAAFATAEELEEASSGISMKRNEDGSLNLGFLSGGGTENKEMFISAFAEMGQMSREDAELLAEGTEYTYEVSFPDPVVQVCGNTQGITIDGKKLVVDMFALKDTTNMSEVAYEFSTSKTPKTVLSVIFDDVNTEDWFADAVYACAYAGLVEGVGDGMFNPEGTLTYAEFCQIYARIDGEVGEENGYWAAKAIKACIENKVIPDRGEICEENYDIPISREAAIAGMMRMENPEPVDEEAIQEMCKLVPDFAEVAPEYQAAIMLAYEIGLTQGVDDSHRFDPKATLTRAEICQLLYNMEG